MYSESNKFYNISMRGRVGYSLLCLEVAINHLKYDKEEWEPVLDQLWSYTMSVELDVWQGQTVRLLPIVVLSGEVVGGDSVRLKKAYGAADPSILQLVRIIYKIGASDLYRDVIGHEEESLGLIDEIFQLMAQIGVDCPDESPFREFKFTSASGRRFEREYVTGGGNVQ